jgi:hypothetical protein
VDSIVPLLHQFSVYGPFSLSIIQQTLLIYSLLKIYTFFHLSAQSKFGIGVQKFSTDVGIQPGRKHPG